MIAPAQPPTLADAEEVLDLSERLFAKLSSLPRWGAFADLNPEVPRELGTVSASITAARVAMARGELAPSEAMRRAVEPFDELVRLRARFKNRTNDL